MADIIVKARGTISEGKTHLLKSALIKAANRIAEIVEETAKKDYLSKRKTDKFPSFIIASFGFTPPVSRNFEARSMVFAGGPSVPYAIYVDKGHKFRGGKGSFPGYHFMATGAENGREDAREIVLGEIGKIMR